MALIWPEMYLYWWKKPCPKYKKVNKHFKTTNWGLNVLISTPKQMKSNLFCVWKSFIMFPSPQNMNVWKNPLKTEPFPQLSIRRSRETNAVIVKSYKVSGLQSFFLLMMYILLPVCTRSVDTKTHAVLACCESVCPLILKALFGHMPYKGPPLHIVWPVKFVEI